MLDVGQIAQGESRPTLSDLKDIQLNRYRLVQPVSVQNVWVIDGRIHFALDDSRLIGELEFEGAAVGKHALKFPCVAFLTFPNVAFLEAICRQLQLFNVGKPEEFIFEIIFPKFFPVTELT